jgi:hypothetical protein
MRRRTAQRLAVLAVLAVAAAAFALAFTHAAPAPRRVAAVRTPARCATRLIQDWRDGRIDGTYPVSCYREAARSLPTDLQVYSSAPDDIRQALARRVAKAGRRAAG